MQFAVEQCHLINDAGRWSLASQGAQVAAGAGGGLADVLQPLVDVANLRSLRVLHVLPEQLGRILHKEFIAGSTVADPCYFPTDPDPTPDPAIFVSDLQDGNKKLFYFYFFYILLFESTFTKFFKKIQSQIEVAKQ